MNPIPTLIITDFIPTSPILIFQFFPYIKPPQTSQNAHLIHSSSTPTLKMPTSEKAHFHNIATSLSTIKHPLVTCFSANSCKSVVFTSHFHIPTCGVLTQSNLRAIVILVGITIGILFGLLIWCLIRYCVFNKPFCLCVKNRKERQGEDVEIGIDVRSFQSKVGAVK